MLSLVILLSSLIILFLVLFSLYYIKLRNKKIIQSYLSQYSQEKNFKNKPLMILGPSGVGKDTFMQMIIDKYPEIFTKCVSCTTRPKRKNEKEGINYYFITKEKFNELDKNGQILGKFEKYGISYGTSKKILKDMLENDKIVYFDYNIETAIKTFNDKSIEFNYIALLPPTMKELADRLRKRGTDNEESIRKRLKYAQKEIELINESKFLNYVIINNELLLSFYEFEMCIKKLYCHFFK